MNVVEYKNRILFRKATISVDAVGNRKNTYTDAFNRWAYANQSTGDENFTAGHTVRTERMDFVVRYDEETKNINTTEYIIVFQNRIYNIINVDNFKMQNKTLTIRAELKERT